VKLNSAGGHEWSTYLGKSYSDSGQAVAVDSTGTCYASGYTSDSSGFFSTKTGYVAKFNSAGTYQWSVALTGKGAVYGVAVDSSGACYATGYYANYGFIDAYVMKLNSAGTPQWSTYLGETGDDLGRGIAVDGSGACYATGYTASSGWTSGGWDTSYNGGNDGYVVKLNSAGVLQWSTYLGGAADDTGMSIAVDGSGACYVTGGTNSSGWMSGGWDTSFNGGNDGYVVKLNSAGVLQWST